MFREKLQKISLQYISHPLVPSTSPPPPVPTPKENFYMSRFYINFFLLYNCKILTLPQNFGCFEWDSPPTALGGRRTAWITSPIPMIGIKVKSCKYIIRRVDQEILADVSWNIIKNCTQRRGSWSIKSEEIWHQMK